MQQDSNNKRQSLLKSGLVVSFFTMLSRVFGLTRDIVIANFIGASAGADAFFVAFKIPNFLRRLFAEGAFAQAFVPVLSEYRETKDPEKLRELINHVAGVLGSILLVITIIAVIAAPLLTWLFAPGFYTDSAKMTLTTDMLRITFPYLILISLTGFAGSILNSFGHFAAPAFTPILLNLSLIGCALFVAPMLEQPVMALAWGVLLAGFLQLLFQLPFLASIGMVPKPRFKPKDEGVKKVAKLMVPALFGVSVSQINLLLDTILASFLITGSVSWLYYSDRLVELPLGVIGIAIATVILPSLSRIHSRKQGDHFSATLDWALRLIVLIGIPAATALVVLANPLITTLFQYGEMTGNDVEKISGSLRAYSLGLLAFMLIKVLAPGYFSRQDTKTPVKIGIKAMVANMVFNLALIVPFAHVGLALATSLSAWLNAYWLYSGLRKEGVYHPEAGWFSILMRIALATTAMASTLWLGSDQMGDWQIWSWFGRSWRLAILCGAGLGIYLLVLLATGVRPNQFVQRTD